MSVGTPGLRQRLRSAAKAEIAEIAIDLFVRKGFEETTVEDITAAAAVSRSSFFRYFPTKESVLDVVDEAGEKVGAALGARPATEAPWVSLRRAFDVRVEEIEQRPERTRAATHLMLTSPTLHASHLRRCAAWGELMIAQLEPRLRAAGEGGDVPMRAAALTMSAMACLDAAGVAWAAAGASRPFGELLDEAMSAVAPLKH
jgi:AcrR family transcriptional regulator